MTREEAIKIIDCYDIGFHDLSGEKIPAYKLADAFDLAIEALQTIDNCDQCEWCCPSDGTPTIHAVRCRNCKYIDCCTRTIGLTRHFDGFREYRSEIIDFCSYGKRKEP